MRDGHHRPPLSLSSRASRPVRHTVRDTSESNRAVSKVRYESTQAAKQREEVGWPGFGDCRTATLTAGRDSRGKLRSVVT
jgi:hypothetical protein